MKEGVILKKLFWLAVAMVFLSSCSIMEIKQDESTPNVDDLPVDSQAELSKDYNPYFDDMFVDFSDNYAEYVNDKFLDDFLKTHYPKSNIFQNGKYIVEIAEDLKSIEVFTADDESLYIRLTHENYGSDGELISYSTYSFGMYRIVDIIFVDEDTIAVIDADIRSNSSYIIRLYNLKTGKIISRDINGGDLQLNYINASTYLFLDRGIFVAARSSDSRDSLNYSDYYQYNDGKIFTTTFDYHYNYTIENTVVSMSKDYFASYNHQSEKIDVYYTLNGNLELIQSVAVEGYLKFPINESVKLSDNGEISFLEYGDNEYPMPYPELEILNQDRQGEFVPKYDVYISDLNSLTIMNKAGDTIDNISSLDYIDNYSMFLVTTKVEFLSESIIIVTTNDVLVPNSGNGYVLYYIYDIERDEEIEISSNGIDIKNALSSDFFSTKIANGFLFAKSFLSSGAYSSYYIFENEGEVFVQYFSVLKSYSSDEAFYSEQENRVTLIDREADMVDIYEVTKEGLLFIETISRSEKDGGLTGSNEGIDFSDPFDPVYSIDNKLINFVGTEVFEEWVKSKGDATITVIDFMLEFDLSADELSEIMGTSSFYDIDAIEAELLKRTESES